MLVMLVLVGCHCSEPTAWQGAAVPFEPPTFYREYWKRVEDCAGVRADFTRVRWFAFPDRMVLPDSASGAGHYGRSVWQTHEVYLAKLALRQSAYIRHEMLHEILQTRTIDPATDDHPPKWFGPTGMCAAEIQCERPLVTDSTGTHSGCSDLAHLYP